jgi:hypothetical protein
MTCWSRARPMTPSRWTMPNRCAPHSPRCRWTGPCWAYSPSGYRPRAAAPSRALVAHPAASPNTCTPAGCPRSGSTCHREWSRSPVGCTRTCGSTRGRSRPWTCRSARSAASSPGTRSSTPPERLPLAFAEFSRVLSPGGHLLLAFQVGSNQRVRLEQAYGHQVSYDAFRLCPDHVTDLLGQAGLAVDARLLREPQPPERTQQAYLMAQKSPH